MSDGNLIHLLITLVYLTLPSPPTESLNWNFDTKYRYLKAEKGWFKNLHICTAFDISFSGVYPPTDIIRSRRSYRLVREEQ